MKENGVSTTQHQKTKNGLGLILNPIGIAEIWIRFTYPGASRSKAIYIKMSKRPDICRLLLDLRRGTLTDSSLADLPESSKEELIKEGLLVKPGKYPGFRSFINRFKSFTSLKVTHKDMHYILNPTIGKIGVWITGKRHNKMLQESSLPAKYGHFVLSIMQAGTDRYAPEEFPSFLTNKLFRKGLLIEQQHAPVLNGLFVCEVGKELAGALPKQFKFKLDNDPVINHLKVNPQIYLQEGAVPPAAIADRIKNAEWINKSEPHIWIENPVTLTLAPYWLSGEHLSLLRQLLEGSIQPDELNEEVKKMFQGIELLVPDNYEQLMLKDWDAKIEKAKQQLEEKNCFAITDLLNPFQVALLRRYVRMMEQHLLLAHDRYFGTRERYWLVNEQACFFVQHQLVHILNRILPERIKPVTNYLTVYKPGAYLKKHIDVGLPMCKYAVSLTIDMQPETDEDTWPLFVEEKGARHYLPMLVGEASIFQPNSVHGRVDKLKANAPSVMLFWFAPENYTGFVNGEYIN